MAHNLYDDPSFFAGYSQLRRPIEGLAGALEWPALRRLLPALEGLRVLDLGCGFGAFAHWARTMGTKSVLGVDLSENTRKALRMIWPSPFVQSRKALRRFDRSWLLRGNNHTWP